MKVSLLIVAVLVVLVIPVATVHSITDISFDAFKVGMGFDSASVMPLSQGTPVYTRGDEVWVESYYNASAIVTLFSPGKPTSVSQEELPPLLPLPVHRFGVNDTLGMWRLSVATVNGQVGSISFALTAVNRSASVNLDSVTLGKGMLSMTLTVRADNAYGLQACTVGEIPTEVALSVPASVGTGELILSGTWSNLTTSLVGKVQQPFSFWFELYHPYSFASGAFPITRLVSRYLRVVSSLTQSYDSRATNETRPTTVYQAMPMREGRYTLRAFFRSDQGLVAREYPLLLRTDGSWVSLSGCVAYSEPASLTFTLQNRLGLPTSQWPRAVLVMFRVDGLEAYSSASLGVALSAVKLIGSPWNQSLHDVGAFVRGEGVEGSDAVNGTVYLMSRTYPLAANLTLMLGAASYQTFSVAVVTPYTQQQLSVPAGKLFVRTTLGGSDLANASVTVSNERNGTASRLSDSKGAAVFYVPSGHYNLTVYGAGITKTLAVSLEPGKELDTQVELGDLFGVVPTYALVGAGIVGLVANIWLWLSYWKARRF